MKININGDITEDDLLKICTFLTDLYHGRKEHINVLVDEAHFKKEEVLELTGRMFGDKPHFTAVIDQPNAQKTIYSIQCQECFRSLGVSWEKINCLTKCFECAKDESK